MVVEIGKDSLEKEGIMFQKAFLYTEFVLPKGDFYLFIYLQLEGQIT